MEGKGPGAKPQFLCCYLCGQQFGTRSLAIHQPQCYQKQMVWWQQADPATRGPKPKDPAVHGHKSQDAMSGDQIQKFNDEKFSEFNDNLSACPNCGRTFLADRLQVHLRSCNPSASGGGSKPAPGRQQRSRSAGDGAGGGGGGGGGRRSSSRGSSRGAGQAPQLLVCYMCGKQFGSRSLGIHMPQCYERALREWKDADPGKRGKRPQDPSSIPEDELPGDLADEDAVQRWNDRNFQRYNDDMSACPNCGRTFLADRLQVHLRSCKASASGGGSKPVAGKAPPPGARPGSGGSRGSRGRDSGPAVKPSMLVCYLCGQQFGSASLPIHQPQCYQKQLAWWKQADPAARGPKPKDPAVHGPSAADLAGKDRDEFNKEQFGDFNANLSACPNCGRTFLADRLVVHLRSCNASASGGGSKPAPGHMPQKTGSGPDPKPRGGSAGPAAKPSMLVCYLCGQQFGSASLPIHQPQCYKKKVAEWEKADPAHRGPRPKDPAVHGPSAADIDGKSRDEFNNEQFGDYNSNLSPCPNCGRTFAADRLQVHLRSCNASKPGGGSKPVAARAQPPPQPQPPRPASPGGGGGAAGGPRGSQSQQGGAPHRSPLVNRVSNATASPTAAHGLDSRTCPGCAAVEYDAAACFCQECGTPLPPPPPPGGGAADAAAPLVCANCGEGWDSGRFCQSCGGELRAREAGPSPDGGAAPPPPPACPECGAAAAAPDARFCEECGTPLPPAAPQPPAATPPASAAGGGGGGGGGRPPSRPASRGGTPRRVSVVEPTEEEGARGRWGPPAAPAELPQVDAEATFAADTGGGGDGDEEGGPVRVDLVPCGKCGRRFAAERLGRHEQACQAQKRRKTFDSHKNRVSGTDMVGHQQTYQTEKRGQETPRKKSQQEWKQQSAALREGMRAAREVDKVLKEGGDLSKLPPPKYTDEANDGRVPCPHCGRRFAPDTAERHIPKCAGTVNRPKAPPKRSSRPDSAGAGSAGARSRGSRGSAPASAPAAAVPSDVAKMGVSPEKWEKIQQKKAKEWEDAYGDQPTDTQPCPNCDRRFVPSSLQVHLRSCGGRHGTSKPRASR